MSNLSISDSDSHNDQRRSTRRYDFPGVHRASSTTTDSDSHINEVASTSSADYPGVHRASTVRIESSSSSESDQDHLEHCPLKEEINTLRTQVTEYQGTIEEKDKLLEEHTTKINELTIEVVGRGADNTQLQNASTETVNNYRDFQNTDFKCKVLMTCGCFTVIGILGLLCLNKYYG